jgi:hypothetical protein
MALGRPKAIGFGVANGVTVLLMGLAVHGLPTRWWVVDVPAATVAALLLASCIGLVGGMRWAERVARAAAFVSLGVGLLLVAMLALSASFLAGIYGPVGRGGVTIMILVAALALPYLVVLPAAQLLWLGPANRSARAEEPAKRDEAKEKDSSEDKEGST